MKKFFCTFTHTLLVAVIVAIAGCGSLSSNKNIEHGLSVENVGTSLISNVSLRYGTVTREFCKQGCAYKGGSFYGVYMPIQNEMFVTWKTADGSEHKADVSVKEKLVAPNRLKSLMLYFNQDHLTVLQALEQEQRGAVGFEKYPLYQN